MEKGESGNRFGQHSRGTPSELWLGSSVISAQEIWWSQNSRSINIWDNPTTILMVLPTCHTTSSSVAAIYIRSTAKPSWSTWAKDQLVHQKMAKCTTESEQRMAIKYCLKTSTAVSGQRVQISPGETDHLASRQYRLYTIRTGNMQAGQVSSYVQGESWKFKELLSKQKKG